MQHDRDHGHAKRTAGRSSGSANSTAPAHRRAGQALVEFAVVIPVLVLIMVAIFDIGRAVFDYNTIANAARQGARVATVNQILTSPDCVEDRPIVDPSNPHWSIKECAAEAATTLDVTSANVAVAYSAPPGTALVCTSTQLEVGCVVSVTVTYTYTPITPVVGQILGPIQMSSTSQQLIDRVFP